MFERFTDRARRVLVLAQEEARRRGHDAVGTEHLVLGLILEEDGVPAMVLGANGISAEAVRRQLSRARKREGGPRGGIGNSPPFTVDAKKALELSLREALQLGHNYIGPEHILLGVIAEGRSAGVQVLVVLGGDLAAIRQQVVSRTSRTDEPRAETIQPRPADCTAPAAHVMSAARQMAGTGSVGTHHVLFALLAEEGSLAASVLAALGVTPAAVQQLVETRGVAGTTDEPEHDPEHGPDEGGAPGPQDPEHPVDDR